MTEQKGKTAPEDEVTVKAEHLGAAPRPSRRRNTAGAAALLAGMSKPTAPAPPGGRSSDGQQLAEQTPPPAAQNATAPVPPAPVDVTGGMPADPAAPAPEESTVESSRGAGQDAVLDLPPSSDRESEWPSGSVRLATGVVTEVPNAGAPALGTDPKPKATGSSETSYSGASDAGQAGEEDEEVAVDEDDTPTMMSVYLMPWAKARAKGTVSRSGETNASLALDAVDSLVKSGWAQRLVHERSVKPRPPDSLFPARNANRRGRKKNGLSPRRVLWQVQLTWAERLIIVDLVKRYGAKSLSELISVAIETYFQPPTEEQLKEWRRLDHEAAGVADLDALVNQRRDAT